MSFANSLLIVNFRLSKVEVGSTLLEAIGDWRSVEELSFCDICSQVNSSSKYWTICDPGCKLPRPLRILLFALSSGGLCTLYYYWLQNSFPFQFDPISLSLCGLCYCTFIELWGSWVNPAKVPKRNCVPTTCAPQLIQALNTEQLLIRDANSLTLFSLCCCIHFWWIMYSLLQLTSKFFFISIWYNFTFTLCSLPFHFDNRRLNLRKKLGQPC